MKIERKIDMEHNNEPMYLDYDPYKVRVRILKGNYGKLLAVADVMISDIFVVRGVRIMDGKNGIFVSLPGYRRKNGTYRDSCYPCSKASSHTFRDAVLRAYEMEQAALKAGT
jgi:stage V sporulation protein G